MRLFSRYVPIDRIESELSTGTLDLAIDREVRTGERTCSVKMISEPWAVVANTARSTLSSRDYVRGRHLVVTQLDGGDPIDDVLAKQGLRRDVGLRCQHYLSACKVVMTTDWLLSMPQTYARQLAHILPLRVLPMPIEVPPLDVYMYWHAVHDAAPEHVWFRRVLIESAVEGSGLGEAAKAELAQAG